MSFLSYEIVTLILIIKSRNIKRKLNQPLDMNKSHGTYDVL